jgi:formamidopyrimidine-DNA glycosylase
MYWTFSNGWYLLNTFGMTGQWSPAKGKHSCFGIRHGKSQILDNQHIYFNDPRHFGTIKFTNNKKYLYDKLNELGWDPLADGISDSNINWIKNKLSNSKKNIGVLLMDQGLFCGVGNYIRAESLYRSKISPWCLACNLTNEEIVNLCQSVVYVMQESYDHQGATILTYKDAYGAEGKYSGCFKVYGKKEDPLGRKVIKEKTPDGRTIHWCPEIQS